MELVCRLKALEDNRCFTNYHFVVVYVVPLWMR